MHPDNLKLLRQFNLAPPAPKDGAKKSHKKMVSV